MGGKLLKCICGGREFKRGFDGDVAVCKNTSCQKDHIGVKWALRPTAKRLAANVRTLLSRSRLLPLLESEMPEEFTTAEKMAVSDLVDSVQCQLEKLDDALGSIERKGT
jgi:hypothetical protein